MKKHIKKLLYPIILSMLSMVILTSCKKDAPESISLSLNGEELTSLEMLNGEEISGITAGFAPADYEGNIEWSSEDSGMVKVSATKANECTITAKKTGTTKVTASCNGISASFKVIVSKDPNNLTARDIAVSVKDVNYAVEMCNIFYAQIYYDFVDTYGDYASYYGIDISGGLSSLKDQACDYSEDGTWYGYFMESALDEIAQVQALCDYADAKDITLDESELKVIEDQIEEIRTEATENGYENPDEYLQIYFGPDATLELYQEYLERYDLAEKTYEVYIDELEYTDEEIEAHYLELGYDQGSNDYCVTSMRHILVMAQADENGEYTQEAKDAAHAKAVEIYEKWLASDQTEEYFAELVSEYSEDSGSSTTGGLYEDIYDGEMVESINNWLFYEKREAGDTVVVDNDGSYVGSHVVYFVGYGEKYSYKLSKSDLLENAITVWFDEVTAGYTLTKGMAYSQIGLF